VKVAGVRRTDGSISSYKTGSNTLRSIASIRYAQNNEGENN
ncbi:17564_t:CDS:1, partial [Acaulospora colombiana]